MKILTFEMFIISTRIRIKKIIRKDIFEKKSFEFTWDGNKRLNAFFGYSLILYNIYNISHSTLFHCSFNSQKRLNFQQSDATVTHIESIDFANEIWLEFTIIEGRKRDRTKKMKWQHKTQWIYLFAFKYWRIEFQFPMMVSQMQIISYFSSYLTYIRNRHYGNENGFHIIFHIHITIEEN